MTQQYDFFLQDRSCVLMISELNETLLLLDKLRVVTGSF